MKNKIAVLLASALLFGAAAAHADIPARSFYMGFSVGGNVPLDDWELGDPDTMPGVPGAGFLGVVRLGGMLAPWVALEGTVGVLPFTSEADGSNLALSYNGDLLFHLTRGDWVPVIDVGAGAYHLIDGDQGSDVDYNAHWGLGLRGMLTRFMAMRIEARHVITDGFDDGSALANNLELSAGLDFFLWEQDHTPPVVDSDGDGLEDKDDECPTRPGPRSTNGCPDRDGDGIVDDLDRCVDVPGIPRLMGCPDRDGDGLADMIDKCPDAAGPQKFDGCPDSDNDGLPDPADKCPNEFGPADNQGCPKPVISEEVKKRFTGALQGIQFETGSAKIRSQSFSILDKAADLLQEFPDIRVIIEGHTDSQGSDAKNLTLSEQRADSVRAYLLAKGVPSERMTTAGYGETNPIASNKTKAGREQNRRIEFRIVQE